MNEYASQIGLSSTHFESPHGLDSDHHYTTAYDLAVITSIARESKLFKEIVRAKDVDKEQYGFSRSFHNINKILWQLQNSTGVKTGFTGKAGKCLVTSVNIEDRDVIIVILNSNTRWKETAKINSYVSKHYKYRKFFEEGQVVGQLAVDGGKKVLNLITDEEIIIPVKDDIQYEVKIAAPKYELKASISKGSKLGAIEIYGEGKKVYTKALVSDSEFKKRGLLRRIFGN
jgi:D-alanyl-D-alanine carboxypeptidase